MGDFKSPIPGPVETTGSNALRNKRLKENEEKENFESVKLKDDGISKFNV